MGVPRGGVKLEDLRDELLFTVSSLARGHVSWVGSTKHLRVELPYMVRALARKRFDVVASTRRSAR